MNNVLEVHDDHAVIYALRTDGQTQQVLIDVADIETVSALNVTWRVMRGKQTLYARAYTQPAKYKTVAVLMHRIILDAPEHMVVDHIDGNGLDNRRSNLRLVTLAGNGQNMRLKRNNTSGYRGVSWHSLTQKWKAQVMVNRKAIHLGLFGSVEDANQAAIRARAAMMPYSREALVLTDGK